MTGSNILVMATYQLWQVGNDRLDVAELRGYRLEINIDGTGRIGSTASGVLLVGGLSEGLCSVVATLKFEEQEEGTPRNENGTLGEESCAIDNELTYSLQDARCS